MKPFCIFRFRCLFTYQIPLICEIRIGGIFVLLGCYRDGCGWVDGCRQWFLVAALEPTETYLLYGAVNLRKQMLKKMRIKCTIWKHFQLFIEFSEERILPVYVLRRLTSICLKFCDLFTQTSIYCVTSKLLFVGTWKHVILKASRHYLTITKFHFFDWKRNSQCGSFTLIIAFKSKLFIPFDSLFDVK